MRFFNFFKFKQTLAYSYECFIIIGSTAMGGPWPSQANVASDLYPVPACVSHFHILPYTCLNDIFQPGILWCGAKG